MGYQTWNWWQKHCHGYVLITRPHNREPVLRGRVEVEGIQKNAKAHFWLITAAKDQYWLQCEINLRSDAVWKAEFDTGQSPVPRTCTLLLVRVSDFAHSLFEDIKSRSFKANYHGAIKMSPPSSDFEVVQTLVMCANQTRQNLPQILGHLARLRSGRVRKQLP